MPRLPFVWTRLATALAAALLTGALAAPAAAAVQLKWIFFDDAAKQFFARPGAQKALDAAKDALTRGLGDSLQARTISDPKKWPLKFDPADPTNPSPPNLDSVAPNGLDIPVDTIPVIVGVHSFSKDSIDHGGCIYSFSDLAHQNKDTVDRRGTGHGVPYYGVVSFSDDPNWSFAVNPPAGASDFITVAEHELGHVLGLNTGAVDWDAQTVSNGGAQQYFVGQAAVAAYRSMGGVIDASHPGVPLDVQTPGHWAPSPGDAQGAGQAAVGLLQTSKGVAIHATMQEHTQARFTPLDYGALQDVGWQVDPSLVRKRR